jgi:hypothetical protein
MVITVDEGKALRRAGVEAMTGIERIHRDMTGGRPPASELKTPLAAITAARILHDELKARMTAGGLHPTDGDWAVSIGYVSTDLSVIGFTPLFAPGKEAHALLMETLDGQIMLGLVFGLVDGEGRIITGSRPFITTKQVDEWLRELHTPVRMEMEDPA